MSAIQGELERRLGHLEEALQRQDNAIIEKDAEIERLKALLSRAAEALEGYSSVIPSPTANKILAELRKAVFSERDPG
jgi:DNA repair exonuclease SbcCD ATPase subunit